MNNYKRLLQIKKYALANDLFFQEIYFDMVKQSNHHHFRKNSLIKTPQGKESLFFLNQGLVIGTKDKSVKGDWTYLIHSEEVFGDYQEIVGAMMPTLNWFALSDIELISISCETFKNALIPHPAYFKKITSHLYKLEFERLETFAEINKRGLPDKLRLLETRNPDLIIESKFKDLAKYIGVSRQHLYRELMNKNYFPSR
ncbi:cyclic nucleotide-binding domain-containing protein [Mongoliitalea daihaiensis]|uniref:hypothetical protein n=1 Tax=Mongoliitalea daihaiensis TaxID=2782006 RepID=UPI001F257662|nr:hypothetical protein [Mongoliitalea daihaiensis]UJP64878.1 Crp/Fnr family transcriptional regulator [Mongoliitalea daihaiensis]